MDKYKSEYESSNCKYCKTDTGSTTPFEATPTTPIVTLGHSSNTSMATRGHLSNAECRHSNTYVNRNGETIMKIKSSHNLQTEFLPVEPLTTFPSFKFKSSDGDRRNRSDLYLPLYYTNHHENSLSIWSKDSTANAPHFATRKGLRPMHAVDEMSFHHEKKHQNSHDDVRSAAMALTSLSLSPVNATHNEETRMNKDRSNITYFTFPPTNTPTRSSFSPETYNEKYSISTSLTSPITSAVYHYSKTKIYPSARERYGSYESDDTRYSEHIKPRSFSHRHYDHQTTHPVPITSKPRSYSFDAVGRASKYEMEYHKSEQHIGCHSAPTSHYRMVQGRLGSSSGDDGIGSSSGSIDSIEHIPSKRKLKSRTVFRCMWRGCDKELTTLSGIILHVRHSHIGMSNAGEEEFYFNDVNPDSTTTSGVSSSSLESIPDECSRRKYRKSVSEETLENVDVEKLHDNTLVNDCQLVTNNVTDNNKSIEHNRMFSIQQEQKRMTSLDIIKKKPTEHLIENLLKDKTKTSEAMTYTSPAHHINSPSFNMSFINDIQVANNTRMFLPVKETPKKKLKGRKKCRKVYGMNNKDLWCTQCRWKKACTRFT